ncbi:hypothetical protein I551_6658 [Mycobacterium ulcerans str. Harvey]|uniref:Uncharacterized protein n=1 Tax=Mycobacterium ulcerans str. Harvey TaxID=1299332 RepID=A0ABN0QQK3_MYCUL|nr:hypothetical protein I551_6658 [Mycobacterium ulcerans str. Harvey]
MNCSWAGTCAARLATAFDDDAGAPAGEAVPDEPHAAMVNAAAMPASEAIRRRGMVIPFPSSSRVR